jgi:hypothetical protein
MATTNTAGNTFPDALALIGDAHRADVMAHPGWTAMAKERNPALQLAWMVRQRLLTYDELDDLHSMQVEASERDRIVEEAFEELGRENAIATSSSDAGGATQ